MKKLIFDPEPRQDFPFKNFLMNPAMSGEVCFPHSGKSMKELVKGSFLRLRGDYFDERIQIRKQLRDMLVDRGYELEEEFLPDDLLSQGAGGVDLTNTGMFAAEGNPYLRGVLINPEFGNIEASHVHLLVDMIRRAVKDRTAWILDIGCGPTVPQKVNTENLGVERIIYADQSSKSIATLRESLAAQGRSDVERRFLEIDKADLAEKIAPDSVRTIIRAGLGMIDNEEARALKKVGSPDVEMFVSNGTDGNPLEQFLEVTEEHFEDIEVHLGYDRYALMCRAVSSA